MSDISPQRFKDSAREIVEEKHREGHWPIYDRCPTHPHPEGRYLYAPWALDDNTPNREWHSAPLARGSVGLFLEFANWPIEFGMDKAVMGEEGKTLDTDKNAAAAEKWAETYGVLGLGKNPNSSHQISRSSTLERTTTLYTGDDNLLRDQCRASRMSPRGGAHEKVSRFATEAWRAHVALRLYVLASREKLDVEAITRLMDDAPVRYSFPPNARPLYPSEREMNIHEEWKVRSWAVGIVNDYVMKRVETDCYPTLYGSPGKYAQGWGFKSLLGAMWLQMMWLMVAEDNTCRWCGEPFDPADGGRKRRFCPGTTCRQSWNYHHGTGASSKAAKKRKRVRQASNRSAN